MVPLALGLSGDFYLVVEKVAKSQQLAIGAAGLLLAFFFGMWFGYTTLRRQTLALERVGDGHPQDAVARVH
jgi:hypothetical protein